MTDARETASSSTSSEPDSLLTPFVLVSEVAEGRRLAEPIFQRKYAAPAPRHGHHVLALVARGACWQPAAYINYLPFEGAMLVGGACTDGQVLAALPVEARALIRHCGGLMLQLVRYAEARFAERSLATFGHCGDARSWSVLAQCGYQRLDHPHLIVRWNREPPEPERSALLERVAALGEF